jgi:hypothetical protein
MKLTQIEVQTVAAKASWYFDLKFLQTELGGDSFVIVGDGIDDLDRLIDLLIAFPKTRIQLDIGLHTSHFQDVGLEDVLAIRMAYIQIYGETDKPPLTVPASSALEV